MIRRIYLMKASGTDPYSNMGMEEYLMMHCGHEECILYLWQNEKTVVIGRNQNAYAECRTQVLEADGGRLARRLSGGGAVFHDLGNLNFTFLVRKDSYDVERQTEVILRAVRKLGAHAERTGRNDITIDGRKFSGNAFYRTGEFCYHHGTLLLHVNKDAMSDYLSVSTEKLRSKGVASVRSRVLNLIEVIPDITAACMAEKMAESFEEVYGLRAEPFPEERIERAELRERTERFASWDWKYGRKLSFHMEVGERFGWGEVQVQVTADEGRMKEISIYTDALDTELVETFKGCMTDVMLKREEISSRLEDVRCCSQLQEEMKRDLSRLFLRLPD